MQEQTAAGGAVRVRFHGDGGEYFGIWIVNLLLSILTLGIYSAWAKVRRLQYFYRNTELDCARFDYHADPVKILKGRLIGFTLFAIYNIAHEFSLFGGQLMFLFLMLVLPLLLRASFRFQAVNSSYRGLRFGFDGTRAQAYKVFLLGPLLGVLSLGLAWPWIHRQIKAYQRGQTRFGRTQFDYQAPVLGFYRIYAVCLLLLLMGPVLLGFSAAALTGVVEQPADSGGRVEQITMMVYLGVGAMVLFMLSIGPYFAARMQNLNWSHTRLADWAFSSDLRARSLFWVQLSNLVLVIVTLGLFKPWADVRVARLRLEAIAMHGDGDSEAFLRGVREAESATGEETAEMFDMDLGF